MSFHLCDTTEYIEAMSDARVVEWIQEATEGAELAKKRSKSDPCAYYNIPCAFDTETTSFEAFNGEKRGTMYVWVFGMNGRTLFGRTWPEYLRLCRLLRDTLVLCTEKRLPVYIHNAMFDLAYMLRLHTWEDIFAMNTRRIVRARTAEGIEYRCSYILTGKGLASLAQDCTLYPVQKLVGDLDYDLWRHSGTPLTAKEEGYIRNDALVVMSYIQQQIETQDNMATIPMTKTGYVRRYCRKKCFEKDGEEEYRRLMRSLRLTAEEYLQARRAFAGGFTHGCAWNSNRVIRETSSWDETSAYPAMITTRKNFPISRGRKVKIRSEAQMRWYLERYCCMFDIRFYGLQSITMIDHPLSYSRCYEVSPLHQLDNGRVVCAAMVGTTITEQDFYTFERFYKWDRMEVGTFRVYRKGYLPRPLIMSVLQLYEEKTTLKPEHGDTDVETELRYMLAKGNINSVYGMFCQKLDNTVYNVHTDGDAVVWDEPYANDIEAEVEKANKSFTRFTCYLWGIWVCALNRRHLFDAIYNVGQSGDYIYSDTDSVKLAHGERHAAYFEERNRYTDELIHEVAEYYDIPLELYYPKTKSGKVKPLGYWDYEETYKAFKFIGAKRYMVINADGELSLTVSGLNKRVTVPWMIDEFGKYGAFEHFNDDLVVPEGYTGKQTHTYIDFETSGLMTDYLGNVGEYFELSSVHLGECAYDLNFDRSFLNYIFEGMESDML